ncbi:hypothetical protein LMG28688_01494 [Paraburkholderia caffeinitolerans]|uniref:Uncharacterized protein n=1 Tax=Paraburkholderia caffeinitolerans TaxID=1723730 RepID=A0A6J5FLR9_9BURK|nr:hypothetical protein LMG28688_01494 [Paraburkholderia caffeinitolerans]
MVIVLVIIVFVVFCVSMASEITRGVPWIFETKVIWGIVAIEAIYTKTAISRGATRVFHYIRRALSAPPFYTRTFNPRNEKRARLNQPRHAFSRWLYSAATTASPIAAVPTCLQSGVTMSAVR